MKTIEIGVDMGIRFFGYEYGIAKSKLEELAEMKSTGSNHYAFNKMGSECEYFHTFSSRAAFATNYVFKDGTMVIFWNFGNNWEQQKPEFEEIAKIKIVKELQATIDQFHNM